MNTKNIKKIANQIFKEAKLHELGKSLLNKVLRKIPAKFKKDVKVVVKKTDRAIYTYGTIVIPKNYIDRYRVWTRNTNKWKDKVGESVHNKTIYETNNDYNLTDLEYGRELLLHVIAHELGHHLWHSLNKKAKAKVKKKVDKTKLETKTTLTYSDWIEERKDFYKEDVGFVPAFLEGRLDKEKFAEMFRLYITKRKYKSFFDKLEL